MPRCATRQTASCDSGELYVNMTPRGCLRWSSHRLCHEPRPFRLFQGIGLLLPDFDPPMVYNSMFQVESGASSHTAFLLRARRSRRFPLGCQFSGEPGIFSDDGYSTFAGTRLWQTGSPRFSARCTRPTEQPIAPNRSPFRDEIMPPAEAAFP